MAGPIYKLFSFEAKKRKMMVSKPDQQQFNDKSNEHELEILKAVAQARQGRAGSSSRATSEFDAHRLKFAPKPTRFRIEAMNSKSKDGRGRGSRMSSRNWDFGQSLWDSYEIVAVSKRIEQGGLVLENEIVADGSSGRKVKREESKNSLRNLFNRVSSRWYNHHIHNSQNHNHNDDDDDDDVLLGNQSD